MEHDAAERVADEHRALAAVALDEQLDRRARRVKYWSRRSSASAPSRQSYAASAIELSS